MAGDGLDGLDAKGNVWVPLSAVNDPLQRTLRVYHMAGIPAVSGVSVALENAVWQTLGRNPCFAGALMEIR